MGRLKEEIDSLYMYSKKIQRLRLLLRIILNEKVALKSLNYKIKNQRFNNLSVFTNKLYGCIRREPYIKIDNKTSDIYEKAVLFKIAYILRDNGYSSMQNGVFKFGQIPDELTLKFKNKNNIIEIDYNVEIERYPKDADKTQIVNLISKNCRPDIKFMVYDCNYTLKNCLIIEIKCSKAKYLYAEEILTDKFLQILNYYALGIYNSNTKKIVSGGIDRIIVPYPKQETSINCKEYNIDFIPLDTSEDLLKEEFKSRLELIIEEYI